MDLVTFFRTVITSEKGWFCLAHAQISDTSAEETVRSWREEFFSWPDEIPAIINRVHELGNDVEIYFSPYLFIEPQSIKQNAVAGKTIVADLDEANILTIQLRPTVLVETSPGRHQGYWILKNELDSVEHETLSKRLTYSIPRCDITGWFLGKKVRVPETYNHKYISGPQPVRIVDGSGRIYTSEELAEIVSPQELFGSIASAEVNEENLDWAEPALNQDIGPLEMLSKVRSSLPTVAARYGMQSRDRSAALWALTMALFRAGLKREQVFYIAYHSPNNKFKELRYGGIHELAKDVIRAESAIKIQLPNIKEKIREARKIGDSPSERNEFIAKLVREHLDKLGAFIHTSDDDHWYIRDDTGKPIHISPRNAALLNMLDNIFGINATETEASYVNHNLSAMVSELPVTGKLSFLSHYDHNSRLFVLHTGRKDLLIVRPTGIERQTNGYMGLVFPWSGYNNTISPNYAGLERPWEDEIFADCLDNILNINKDCAKAILKTWFITVLLRDGLSARPILALFGMPGSGKSTLFRRVYTLMYGREKGLNSVTTENDFDHAMSKDPLVVLDNVDTYTSWLPDRLAATVSPTEIQKRKLFTDSDTFTLRRSAMLGITAHNPKFGRMDVTDRLLLFSFERLSKFKPENVILDRIDKMRNVLWGAILTDIQTVLNTPMPTSGFPQFRIEDFAQYGYWISKALGCDKQFVDGINSIQKGQRSFNLEEDMMLIEAIDRLLKHDGPITELTAGALWIKLGRISGDQAAFNKKYKNAVSLGKKLWVLIDSLRDIYDIEWTISRSIRVWNISQKEKDALKDKVGTNVSTKE